jgi:hypothetical protein
MVLDPDTGAITDVWMWKTSSSDYSTELKKLLIDGKQYFYLGVNAYTDYIYWGFVHGGVFKLNETFGYVEGYFLGSQEAHNKIDGLDLDYYGNYYLGWERWWQHPDPTSWVWGTPLDRSEWGGWGGWEHNVMWGKVAPVSQSL